MIERHPSKYLGDRQSPKEGLIYTPEGFLRELYNRVDLQIQQEREAEVSTRFDPQSISHWDSFPSFVQNSEGKSIPSDLIYQKMDLERGVILQSRAKTYGIAIGLRQYGRIDILPKLYLQIGSAIRGAMDNNDNVLDLADLVKKTKLDDKVVLFADSDRVVKFGYQGYLFLWNGKESEEIGFGKSLEVIRENLR